MTQFYKPKFNHPIGKEAGIEKEVPKEAIQCIEQYQKLMDDMYVERLANRYIKNITSGEDLRERYLTAYRSAKRKGCFKLVDKIREILMDIGFSVSIKKESENFDVRIIRK